MPIMNGMDAAKILRERHGAGFKIYILTGNVLVSNREEVKTIVDGLLMKPCTILDLQRCLNSLAVL